MENEVEQMDIQLELSQSQILSPKLIQSLEILQMSSQEMIEYIKDMSMENPVVDLEEVPVEDKEQEYLKKLEWLATVDEQNRIYYRQETEDSDLNDIMNIGERMEETLKDNLMAQLIGKEYTKKEYKIFEYIADCIDTRGFFTEKIEFIAVNLNISIDMAQRCLDIMKNLEPMGVCSANLEECLLKQLEYEGEKVEVERQIVAEYLELLGKNQLHVIAKQMKLPLERVQKAKLKIQSLNPKPGCGFSSRDVLRYLTPDVTVVKLKDYFEVLVNDTSYPVLRVNQDYMRMLKTNCSKEAKHYILDKAKQIEQVQTCISKRNSTLLELGKCIVEAQQEFFLEGKGCLKPLRMKDAAETLGVHESTISRAVKEKYIQCCWGIYPLGYFFSKGFYQKEDEEKIATIQIKEKLKELIDEEDKKKTASDQKLSEQLSKCGIDISRRTVAKYRESMGIADCRGRKEFV